MRARRLRLITLTVLAALALSAAIFLAVQESMANRARDETLDRVLMSQTRAELENLVRAISEAVLSVSGNSDVQSFSLARPPLGSVEHYAIYQIVQSFSGLRNMLSTDGIVRDIAAYFPYTDTLVNVNAYYPTRSMFTDIYRVEGLSYDEFAQSISQYTSGRILPAHVYGGNREMLVYMQSLDKGERTALNVLIFLDKLRVQQLIADLETAHGDKYLFVKFGGALLESGAAPEALSLALSMGEEAQGYAVQNVSSVAYRNLTYHLVQPKTMAGAARTRIIAAVLALSALAAIAIAVWLAHAARARKAMEAAPREADQWPIFKQTVLERLTGDPPSDSTPSLGAAFPDQYFQVVILYCGADLPKAAQQTAEELSRLGASAYAIDPRTLALIFNFDEATADHRAAAEMLRSSFRAQSRCAVTACLGSVQPGFDGIRASYEDAVKCYDLRVFTGADATIALGDFACCEGNYAYPMNVEIDLITAARAGNLKKARCLLQALRHENFEVRQLKPDIARIFLSDLTGTIVKIIEYSDPGAFVGNPLLGILSAESVDEAFRSADDVLAAVCQKGAGEQKIDEALKRRIADYLQAHFTDLGFSQTVMAEDLNLSPNYLSSLFKQMFGDTMVSYVNDMRVQKARELLKSADQSVELVARMVGFSSSDAFTRAFKKRTGMTPGNFRQTL